VGLRLSLPSLGINGLFSPPNTKKAHEHTDYLHRTYRQPPSTPVVVLHFHADVIREEYINTPEHIVFTVYFTVDARNSNKRV
jgi:hypothetical protein